MPTDLVAALRGEDGDLFAKEAADMLECQQKLLDKDAAVAGHMQAIVDGLRNQLEVLRTAANTAIERAAVFDDGSDGADAESARSVVVILRGALAPQPATQPFQQRVLPWLLECFGEQIACDANERNHRFLEEALELVQACGCTADEAHRLVDYVYGREVGERAQEVGGVMVTLAALCLAQKLDMHQAGETELARITQPAMVERIREKQKRKPAMSPLPGVYPGRTQQDEGEQAERHEPLHITHRPLIRNAIGLLGMRRPMAPDVERVVDALSAMLDGLPTPAGAASDAWLRVAELSEAPAARQGWISVGERLPDEHKAEYLCLFDDGHQQVTEWLLDDTEGWVFWYGNPTHWMPLLAAPAQQEQQP